MQAREKTQKQKKIEEREARMADKEMNKIYKPSECMEYMYVELHPSLASAWYMADVPREVAAISAHIMTTSAMCDTCLVMWNRLTPQTLNIGFRLMQNPPRYDRCEGALYVSMMTDIAFHVESRALSDHMRQVRALAGTDVTLVIFGVDEYFKSTARKTLNSFPCVISEIELEIAMTDLLVTVNCDTIAVNSSSELALLIAQYTKAIGEAPYKKAKRAQDELSEFYLRGENKNCVTVDKQGNGVGRLWQQMIAVLPHSSLETSRALCAEYPTPLDLYESLKDPDSITNLANIGVSRTAVPGSKARRIGPEFARKLHALFTATDGDVLLD